MMLRHDWEARQELKLLRSRSTHAELMHTVYCDEERDRLVDDGRDMSSEWVAR
jgi:hypothetical protein